MNLVNIVRQSIDVKHRLLHNHCIILNYICMCIVVYVLNVFTTSSNVDYSHIHYSGISIYKIY